MKCHRVIISIASNYEQEENLRRAHECLEQVLALLRYTEQLWTEPITTGHSASTSPPYLNQLVEAYTTLDADELQRQLKAIEHQMGRTIDDRRQNIVRIDLDLLLHGDCRYHVNDWPRPYVQQLIGQLTCSSGSTPVRDAHSPLQRRWKR